jgi:prepilin-type N-terminal cleavage/methylation domain-containing protein
MTPKKTNSGRGGFTLVELLVVISIIGILAGFTLAVLGAATRSHKISTARGEMAIIQAALDAYHAKYNAYPPSNQNSTNLYLPQNDRSQLNQLYYELSGTTINGGNLVTLDGSASITSSGVQAAYNVGGFLNSTKGGGEDSAAAKNFIAGISSKMIFGQLTNNGTPTTFLVTSVGGPDVSYHPLGLSDVNPFRYVYPGVKNPSSYDLWVQLVTKPGTTNLVCNWSKATQINTADP